MRLTFDTVALGGLDLRLALTANAGAAGTRSLFILPGRSEFIEKYAPVIDSLAERGFACAILDWRGQGGSTRLLPDPWRGHVTDFGAFLEDFAAFRRAVEPHLPPPRFALAHSMGGHILLRALLETDGAGVEGAVLGAPLLDLPIRGMGRAVTEIVVELACRLGFAERYLPGFGPAMAFPERFEGNRLTGNREAFEAFARLCRSQPELSLGGATFGWFRAALRSIRQLRRDVARQKLAMPVLLAQAGGDRVVCNGAQDRLAARDPAVRLERFEGAQHELLIERPAIREAFLDRIDSFLRPPS